MDKLVSSVPAGPKNPTERAQTEDRITRHRRRLNGIRNENVKSIDFNPMERC